MLRFSRLVSYSCLSALIALPGLSKAQLHGAAVPDSISFQGILADTSGAFVSDGAYNLLFRMYKGGNLIWEQNHLNVPVASGRFNVILAGTNAYPLDTVAFNQPIDLGITVNGGVEMTPRTPLTSAPYALGMRGLSVVDAVSGVFHAPNLIGGASNNYIADGVAGATIGGGGGFLAEFEHPNVITSLWGTIGGGESNSVSGASATISGGSQNSASGVHSTVGGGVQNSASGTQSSVGGGWENTASGPLSTVGGGLQSSAAGDRSAVGGGELNQATGVLSTIPGGYFNEAGGHYSFAAGRQAKALHDGSFVWADSGSGIADPFFSSDVNQFLIRAAGGVGIGTNTPGSQLTVNGMIESEAQGFKFPDGSVQTSAAGGGSFWSLAGNAGTNPATDFVGTTDTATFVIRTADIPSLRLKYGFGFSQGVNIIGGIPENGVGAGVVGATIGGGGDRDIDFGVFPNSVSGSFGTVGGGRDNSAGARATVGGGSSNTASSQGSTVSGGKSNLASGNHSAVSGGEGNKTSAHHSTISGGQDNRSKGIYSTVPGGYENHARGNSSYAAGRRARAAHDGTFVWSDGTFVSGIDSMVSTGPNQFLIRASGGVGIGTNSPNGFVDVDNVFKIQTDHTGAENQNARLFLSESNNNKANGYSLVYAGDASQTFDGTAFSLPANELHFVRHNSSELGNVVMSMNRATGRVAMLGGVGIGTTSPDQELTISDEGSDGDALISLKASSPAAREMVIGVNQSFGGFVSMVTNNSLGFRTNGTTWIVLETSGDTRFEGDVYPRFNNQFSLGRSGNEWSEVWSTNGTIQNSDRRLKSEITRLQHGLKQIMQLEPVSFKWKSNPEQGVKLGLIAQDVQDVIPEVVDHGGDPDAMLGMNYAELIPVLIKAIQEQQDIIESQSRRLAELEAHILN